MPLSSDLSSMSDLGLLEAIADAADEFREAVIADPKHASEWLYRKGAAPHIEQASRDLVDLLAERLRRKQRA